MILAQRMVQDLCRMHLWVDLMIHGHPNRYYKKNTTDMQQESKPLHAYNSLSLT